MRLLKQYKKSTEGRDQKPLRWKTCIKATEKQLDVAAGAIYVDQNFDVNDKIEVSR